MAVATFLGWHMLCAYYAVGARDAKITDNRHLKGHFGHNLA